MVGWRRGNVSTFLARWWIEGVLSTIGVCMLPTEREHAVGKRTCDPNHITAKDAEKGGSSLVWGVLVCIRGIASIFKYT